MNIGVLFVRLFVSQMVVEVKILSYVHSWFVKQMLRKRPPQKRMKRF